MEIKKDAYVSKKLMLPIWEDIIVPGAKVSASNALVDCIFLWQFKYHLLGNNVFLNRQFSLFLLVKKETIFIDHWPTLLFKGTSL
jgi:hypothetical protein